MMEISSKSGFIQQQDEKVFNFLSDFRNIGQLFKDKVSEWEATEKTCRFKVQNYPVLGLKIADVEPNHLIKITEDGQSPIKFTIVVNLKLQAPQMTNVQININADVPFMMKSMVEKPLQMFADGVVDFLCAYNYEY